MEYNDQSRRYDAQPGLEVVAHQAQPWLEVRNDYYNDSKELVVPKYPETFTGILPPPSPSQPLAPNAAPAELDSNPPSSRKKRLRIVVAVAVAVVVIAAVLGGVLGSRASRSDAAGATLGSSDGSGTSSGPKSTPSTGSSSNSTSTRPQTVRQGTALTIGGWRKPNGDVELWLFYQDPQDGLRYSRCNSTRPLDGQKTCWGPQKTFNSNARANAQLAVGLLIFGTRHQPQTELFYSGISNRLLGTNFNDQSVPFAAEDSVNTAQITTGTNSSLTSYWPWAIFQDAAGVLWHVRNQVIGAEMAPASQWDVNKLNFTAMAGSKLAMVPVSTNFVKMAIKGGYAVFYQAVDGKLAVGITDLDSPQLDANYALSWPTQLPSITLPRLASIAAFSVARRDDPQQRVDTYVLYADASSNINMLYTDSSSGSAVWKRTQPAALRSIDKDSNIACLSFSTTTTNSASSAILLEPASEEMKCFFQRGGQIMEAKLVGTDWEVTGNVPIP